jgi:hypothetical protein
VRVAIIGSRNFPDEQQVYSYVSGLPSGTTVVSGGADGVDSWAAAAARTRGLGVVTYEPNYELHGKRAPLVRNEAIAIDCDRMVAFWDGKSRGTMHAVQQAERLGRPVMVIESRP